MGTDEMRVLTTEGLRLLIVQDDDDRSVIGQHHNAIGRAKEGEVSALKPFVGRTISARAPREAEPQPGDDEPQQFELEANLTRIKRWLAQGELDYETIYEQ
jgi:hypothetical protein